MRTTVKWFGRRAPSRSTETELHEVQLILQRRYMLRQLSLNVERHIYIVIITQYLFPHSVWITGFSFTMNRSLCNSACCSEYNLMNYIDFIPLRQNVNTRLITHIYIHKHQFLHVDETQNYRNNTVYELIQPEQKISVALSVVALPNLIR